MKYKITMMVALIGLIIVGAATIKITSQPSFCSQCHAISPLVTSWEESVHQNISCMSCHSEPGAVGLIKRKAFGLKEVYVHFTNPEIVPKAKSDTWAFSQRCLDCHENIRPEHPQQVNQLAHNRRHFELEITCVSCHQGVAHPRDGVNPLPSQEVCSNCHGTTFQ